MNTVKKSAVELQVGDIIVTRVWKMDRDHTGKVKAFENFATAVVESADAYLFRSNMGIDVTMKVQGVEHVILDSFSETDMIEVLN
jgi:hypothetical protein